MRGILDTPCGVRFRLQYLQAYAKNAYAWLISGHASGVLKGKLSHDSGVLNAPQPRLRRT